MLKYNTRDVQLQSQITTTQKMKNNFITLRKANKDVLLHPTRKNS